MAYFPFRRRVKTDEPEKWQFYLVGVIIFSIILFILNNISSYLIDQYQANSALSSGYKYIEYINLNASPYTELSVPVMGFIYLLLILFTVFSFIKKESLYKKSLLLATCFVPFVFLIYHYQSLDKFMYKPISNLYNISSKEKSFVNSEVGMRFRKALIENDYESLKSISNDLTSLMGVPTKLLSEKEQIVKVIPIPELQLSFNSMKKEFTSYSEYKDFYTKSLEIFKQSDLNSRPEFVLLMSMLVLPEDDYSRFLQNYYTK